MVRKPLVLGPDRLRFRWPRYLKRDGDTAKPKSRRSFFYDDARLWERSAAVAHSVIYWKPYPAVENALEAVREERRRIISEKARRTRAQTKKLRKKRDREEAERGRQRQIQDYKAALLRKLESETLARERKEQRQHWERLTIDQRIAEIDLAPSWLEREEVIQELRRRRGHQPFNAWIG